jgi:hypothetical protein
MSRASNTVVITSLILASFGVAASCSLTLDLDSPPSQCWCGEQWRSQISGARAYGGLGDFQYIPASATSYSRCVSMLEHVALDAADPQDPVYLALRQAFESAAVSNCELAGAALWPNDFSHTDCATVGTGTVTSNLVYLGSCWEWEGPNDDQKCPLQQQCGQFYDCSDDPIIRWAGFLQVGETEGAVPWTGDEELWSCDEEPDDESARDPDRIRF